MHDAPLGPHSPPAVLFAELERVRAESLQAAARREEALDRVLERQQLLIGELAHRMKNTLAMVQAIVSQTLRMAPSLPVAREQVMQRFAVLARAQDILTQADWDSAALDVVVAGALEPLAPDQARVSCSGPPVRLSPRAALNFTLAVHELATNARRYGALSTPGGRAEVSWAVQDGVLDFCWEEFDGPAVEPPSRKGFGSRLLDSLARTFDAEVELLYAPSGMRWRVRIDLAALKPA